MAESLRARATSADVARLARVSRATVSYVLNDVVDQKISSKTRESVLEAVRVLNYRPNESARRLASGRSRIALLLVPRVRIGEVISELAGALTSEMAASGFVLSVHFESPENEDIAEVARRLDASVVVTAGDMRPADASRLAAAGILSLSLLSDPHSPVRSLHEQVGAEQIRTLHARGHRHIAFAGTAEPNLQPFCLLRRRGAEAVARELGLPPLTHECIAETGQDAGTSVRQLYDKGITAIAAFNDDVALAVLHGIRLSGLECPVDLAVIGADDEAAARVSAPPLTSIRSSTPGWAATVTDMVIRATGQPDQYSPPATAECVIEVVARASA